MRKNIFSAFLALVCIGSMALPAFAAEHDLTLSGESAASALTKIYNYKPLTSARSTGITGAIKSDEVFCTVTERICDDKGGVYRIIDSTPLADTALFSRKTTVTLGAQYVSTIAPADYDNDGFLGSSFQIKLSKDYSGQHAGIGFDNLYTAKQDVTLRVREVSTGKEYSLLVEKGAQITSECELLLSSSSIDVTKYPESRPPYQSILERERNRLH